MFDLPLFPLKLVLFPGMPLTLHIFEERYKKMVQHCVDLKIPFGIVLIEKGKEAQRPLAQPYRVGTTAQVFRVEKLTQGKMNIIAIGQERFQIQEFENSEDDYLIGKVEYLPIDEGFVNDLQLASSQLRPWLNTYMDLLQRANMLRGEIKELPDNPLELAYLAGYLLQTPARHKQPLLEAKNLSTLLTDLQALYKKEVVLLKALMQHPEGKEGAENWLN